MTEPLHDTEQRIAALSPEQRELLMRRLRERSTPAPAAAAPAEDESDLPAILDSPFDLHEPAPLSEIQAAFWMSGSGLFDLGGSNANVYVEYEAAGIAGELAGRLNAAVTRAVIRHPMLRTVVLADGLQRVLAQTPPYEVRLVSLSRLPDAEIESHLASTREWLRYTRHPADRWPLFDMVVHQLPGEQIRFQARFDAMLVDGTSRVLLINELIRGVLEEERAQRTDLPPLEVNYLDFVRSVRAFRESSTWKRSRAYWLDRLPALPPAPRLPLLRDFGPETVPRVAWRNVTVLDRAPWAELCRRAAQHGMTPSGIGTAILAETLRSWSEEPSFTLGLSGSYYPPIHPQLRQIVGTFTTLYLLAVEEDTGPFVERARRLQDRLSADLDHQHFSGHELLRELNRTRRAGGRATLPIQFTSILRSVASSSPSDEPEDESRSAEPMPGDLRQLELMIALPQVLLFWVLGESSERSLFLISQAVEEIFPPGLVEDLIDGYRRLAARLADDETAWMDWHPLRMPEAAAPRSLPHETSNDPLHIAARELTELAELGPGDRLLALSPPGSLLALCEALAAHAKGADLIVPSDRAPEALAALAAREQVTVWSSAPAVLERVLHCIERNHLPGLPSLRRVLLHRDRVPLSLSGRLRALAGDAQLLVTWGIESVPIAAAGLAEESGPCLIVRAASAWNLHVLDRQLAPRPTWVAGDLYLGTWDADGSAERLQTTGQRARRLPGGRIELLGDELAPLVEVLGYGSDPRRVEAALQRHPAVRHAVVAQKGNERRLAAWLLLQSGQSPSDGELRDHLRTTLPEHLVPAVFTRLEELPLSIDGIVDRASLVNNPLEPAPPGAALWSPLAAELAVLWEEILGCRPATPDDDFYSLGGNSLLATRLLGRVASGFGLETPLSGFLDQPTVGRLAEIIDRARAENAQRKEQEKTAAKPSPLHRLRDSLVALKGRLIPPPTSPAYNLRLYLLLWFCQFISAIGTGLGSFALGVWVYRQSASTTQYAMMGFLATCTALLVGPLAGVLADRWDRRRLILLGDLGATVMTCLMALALYTGSMRLWHVYFVVVFMVGFGALQRPALIASTSLLVSRRQLGRVAGLTQAAGIATGIICPPLSGSLVASIGYSGVIVIDISTFMFAFLVVLFIRLPRPAATTVQRERPSFLRDLRFGWSYLRQRPGLLSLMSLFATTNFFLTIVQILLTPLILSFGSASNLGFVNSATAAGALIGSLALSVWGGPRNRIAGILAFTLLQAPVLLLGAVQPNVMLIAAAAFIFASLSPFVGGLSEAIWQTKVAHDVQGRVFAMRGFIISAVAPVAFLLAGPLADRVFEPLLAPGGALAGTIGRVIGIGKGRGVGLLFIIFGLLIILIVLVSSLNPRLRKVESELPDASTDPEPAHGMLAQGEALTA
jgi:non-ribosomal peptide synthetase component F/MFS family permease